MKTDGMSEPHHHIISPQRLVAAGEADQRIGSNARIVNLTESAMISRLTSDDFIPSGSSRSAGDGDRGESAKVVCRAPLRRLSWRPAPGDKAMLMALPVPGGRHPDQRLVDLLFAEAHRIEKGAMRRAFRADRDVPARHVRFVDCRLANVVGHGRYSCCGPIPGMPATVARRLGLINAEPTKSPCRCLSPSAGHLRAATL
jgi:hypothetical protein